MLLRGHCKFKYQDTLSSQIGIFNFAYIQTQLRKQVGQCHLMEGNGR